MARGRGQQGDRQHGPVLADAKQHGLTGPNVAELVNRVAVPHKDIDIYAEAEDWATDRIRELQELRKSTGLDVSDRIKVVMSVPLQRRDRTRIGT